MKYSLLRIHIHLLIIILLLSLFEFGTTTFQQFNYNHRHLIENENNTTNENENNSTFKSTPTFAKLHNIYRGKGPRIAIIVSGQLRSGNLTWDSGHIHVNSASKMFGSGDPTTPVATIIENMLIPLSKEPEIEGIDVFMYMTAHPDQPNSTYWDGVPLTFEPSVGDTTVCNPFSNHHFFHHTNHRIFCLVEPEVQLLTPIIEENLNIWDGYTYRWVKGGKEQVLQQYYGMYRANLASKEYALLTGANYTYKVRVRPDTAVVKPFPPLASMDFNPKQGCPGGQIWFANKVIFKTGNEDWFDIGKADSMNHLLDRYLDFISDSFQVNKRGKNHWDLEDNLIGIMEKYGVCMAWYYDIWMVVIRRIDYRGLNTWLPPHEPNQWVDLSTY